MDALLLARIQFGFTVSFHIVFPGLTIGLASYLAVLEGLWLRTGHGTLGWTMAAGSGRLTTDRVTGRRPDIDPDGFGIERYRAAPRPRWQPRFAI